MAHNRAIITTMGIILAALFGLFPEWQAVHPTDPTLSVTLGHAWIFSPPSPPGDIGAMRVERGNLGYILAVIVLLVTGLLYWAEGRGGRSAR